MVYRARFFRIAVWFHAVLLFFFSFTSGVYCLDNPVSIDPTLRSGDRQESLMKDKDEMIPKPEIVSPSPAVEMNDGNKGEDIKNGISVFVKKIEIIGSTVFSKEKLSEITKPYENKKLSHVDLEEIRRKITVHYIQNGYVNSGAVLPDQAVSDGKVTYMVVEGALSNVTVSGNERLRDRYYINRIEKAAEKPLNVNVLGQCLQMLQQNDLVKRIHAELKPGMDPGKSELDIKVEERSPWNVWASFNNYQSPSVGSERGLVTLTHKSATGFGDVVSLTYGRSDGLDPLVDASFLMPVTTWDTELGFRYRNNDFDIVEEPFQSLDITSTSSVYEVKVRQPFFRTPNRECALGISGERLRNKTTLLGEPYSFSKGSVNGVSEVDAIRFFQEYIYRTRENVAALQSRFSWGIDAFDATMNGGKEPDARFFSWLGQAQWVGIFSSLEIQNMLKTDIQIADDRLLSLEQIPIGGRYSVRGYRENQLVSDNGVIASMETRIPLVRKRVWADYFQLAPFFDFGRGWNRKDNDPDPKAIYSIGLGLRWALTMMSEPFPVTTELEFYWGHPLKDVDTDGSDLQDDGFHFQLSVSAF